MAVINGRGTWGVRAFMSNIISSDSTWTRPTDWLALNAPTGSTEQFTGLLAITNDDSNYVTLVALSTGNYTVDWGDGTITSHTSGAVAGKKYEYSAISESTLTSRGYKQVVVKLTGTNITQCQTIMPHSAISTASSVLYTWLEYHINLPNCSFLRFNRGGWTNGAFQTWVEKVTINKLGNQTSFASLFNSFYSLQEVAINATTTGVTDTQFMFNDCYSLKSVPLFNTSNVLSSYSMFSNCFTLTTIPSLDFAKSVTAALMFQNCYSLESVPALNLGSSTTLQALFENCHSLKTITSLTTTNSTQFNSTFSNCYSLETVPLFDTSKGTTFGSMFINCYSLIEIPAFNTIAGVDFSSMFRTCGRLTTIPLLNTQKGTNFTTMFTDCYSLTTLPALNLNSGTTFTSMFVGTYGVSEAPFINIRNSFTFVNMSLSRTAIVNIFNGLASGVSAKIITVSGNPGYSSLSVDERAIATGKGWTIA